MIESKDFETLVMDVLYKASKYMNEVFMPKHGIKTGEPYVERYTSHSAEANAMEIWMPILSSHT